MDNSYYRGEIYYVKSGQQNESGSVQRGGRPAIIVSNDIGNEVGPVLEVVYLTTQEKKPLPTHVQIMSAKMPSTALCEQIVTIYKDKVGDYIGQCSMAEMKRIDSALAVSVGIGMNIKGKPLVEKWRDAVEWEPEKKEEAAVPTSNEVKIVSKVEDQLEIARVTAERDVYKKLYEELLRKVG